MRKGKNVRVRGRWWHYQFEANGQTYSGNTGLAGCEPNRIAAESYAEQRRRELLAERPRIVASGDPGRKEFMAAAQQFAGWARSTEYRTKPNTARRLETSLASAKQFFGDRPLRSIDAASIELYKQFRVEEHGVRDVTVRHDLHALSVFFRYAIKNHWCDKNPIAEVKIPSDRDSIREHVVSPEEEERYLAAAQALHERFLDTRMARGLSPEERAAKRQARPEQPNLRDLAMLMLDQGARPEELVSLSREDVDLAAGTIAIRGGKTRAARRTLNLTARSRAVLARRLAAFPDSPWLFPSQRYPGRHVSKWQATHDRICREARLCFVVYDFRHTFATRAIAAGVDVPTVAAILGHSGLRVIFRYVHPSAGQQKRAMELVEAAANRARLKVVS